MNTAKYSKFSWARSARNPDQHFVVGNNTKTLPSGFYIPDKNDDGSFTYERHTINTDQLICFDNSATSEILGEINTFWNSVEKFKKYGFLQRRGYMFYGPPGSGKTAIAEQIISATINNNGVAFMCRMNPFIFSESLTYFRKYEPDRSIVCLFEDIDSIIERYGESELLSCLDGENQVDHVLNIATTNYPENLDKRIISRPRRFDRIVKIAFPDADTRKQYFIAKLNIDEGEVKQWVNLTENFSFAGMSDLVINVKCFDYDLNDSVKRVAATLKNDAHSKEF